MVSGSGSPSAVTSRGQGHLSVWDEVQHLQVETRINPQPAQNHQVLPGSAGVPGRIQISVQSSVLVYVWFESPDSNLQRSLHSFRCFFYMFPLRTSFSSQQKEKKRKKPFKIRAPLLAERSLDKVVGLCVAPRATSPPPSDVYEGNVIHPRIIPAGAAGEQRAAAPRPLPSKDNKQEEVLYCSALSEAGRGVRNEVRGGGGGHLFSSSRISGTTGQNQELQPRRLTEPAPPLWS